MKRTTLMTVAKYSFLILLTLVLAASLSLIGLCLSAALSDNNVPYAVFMFVALFIFAGWCIYMATHDKVEVTVKKTTFWSAMDFLQHFFSPEVVLHEVNATYKVFKVADISTFEEHELLAELQALEHRIADLARYMQTEAFTNRERGTHEDILLYQLSAMAYYYTLLRTRCEMMGILQKIENPAEESESDK